MPVIVDLILLLGVSKILNHGAIYDALIQKWTLDTSLTRWHYSDLRE